MAEKVNGFPKSRPIRGRAESGVDLQEPQPVLHLSPVTSRLGLGLKGAIFKCH